MSALTSSQINQSYQGLLKLEDSSTGITSSVQAIQDGLGNDTGIQIATNRLQGGSLYPFYKPTPAKYYGTGYVASGPVPTSAGNVLTLDKFYDNGLYSYSAITVNCTTLGVGESIDLTFYNAQYLNGYGYVPYQKLITEINIPTTSTGLKVITFPSTLSFSGQGPGVYFVVTKWNVAGTPATRMGNKPLSYRTTLESIWIHNNGIEPSTTAAVAVQPQQTLSVATNIGAIQYNTGTFPTTWTSTELNLISNTVGNDYSPGFLLHTIR